MRLASRPDPVKSAVDVGLRYVNGTEPGILRKRKGRGFVYLSPQGTVIRDPAILRRIRSLVIPPAWEQVWICDLENGHLQATGRDARGRKQYRYHASYREHRNRTNFDRLVTFGEALPLIRKAVQKDLQEPGVPKNKVLSAVVRLLDETCIRIGNDEYARQNDSYGLTTFRNDHADVKGDLIRFRFRGKSGIDREINLRDPQLARVIRKCQELPGEQLFEFQTGADEFQPIGSGDVNEYLRAISGADLTAKDFRTWHGTSYALRELVDMGPASSESEAKRNIVAAVKTTSSKLGNRPATARRYYIHPAVMEWYSTGKLFDLFSGARPGQLRSKEESAVLELAKEALKKKRAA